MGTALAAEWHADEPQLRVAEGDARAALRAVTGQPVIADAGAVREGDAACPRVEPGGQRAEPQVDVVLVVPLGRMQRAVCGGRVQQELLGQRRPLVGHGILTADQRDGAVKAVVAQFGYGRRAGRAAADHDHPPRGAHGPVSTEIVPSSPTRHP